MFSNISTSVSPWQEQFVATIGAVSINRLLKRLLFTIHNCPGSYTVGNREKETFILDQYTK